MCIKCQHAGDTHESLFEEMFAFICGFIEGGGEGEAAEQQK